SRDAPTVVPVGGEFQVNTFTTGDQANAKVAFDAAGDFVVAWTSYQQDGSGPGVYGQRFSAAGAPLGPEVQANTFTTYLQYDSSVAMDAAGDCVIAWTTHQDASGAGYQIYAKRYNAAGAELPPPAGVPLGLGNEFRVNSVTTARLGGEVVAMDAAGDFVI